MHFNLLVLMAIFTVLTQTTGCSSFIASQYAANSGINRVTVGEVSVQKSLEFIGGTVDDTLIVFADENGNGIIAAGKGKLELTPLVLNNSARNQAIDMLKKLRKWGETASNNRVEISKNVGNLTATTGIFSGSTIVGVDFISSAEGKTWLGKMDFCYIDPKALGSKKPIGYGPCDREITVYVGPSAANELVTLLEQVPISSDKAKHAKSKNDLFN